MSAYLNCCRIPVDLPISRMPQSDSVSIPVAELSKYGPPGKFLHVISDYARSLLKSSRYSEIIAEVDLIIEPPKGDESKFSAYLQASVRCVPRQGEMQGVENELAAIEKKLRSNIREAAKILVSRDKSSALGSSHGDNEGSKLAYLLNRSCARDSRETNIPIENGNKTVETFVFPPKEVVVDTVRVEICGQVVSHDRLTDQVGLNDERNHHWKLTIEPSMLSPLLKAAIEDRWVVLDVECDRTKSKPRSFQGHLFKIVKSDAGDRAPAMPALAMI